MTCAMHRSPRRSSSRRLPPTQGDRGSAIRLHRTSTLPPASSQNIKLIVMHIRTSAPPAPAVSALGQSQHALADDVALDFAGAARDRRFPRRDYPAGPFAALDGSTRPALEIRVRTQHLIRE